MWAVAEDSSLRGMRRSALLEADLWHGAAGVTPAAGEKRVLPLSRSLLLWGGGSTAALSKSPLRFRRLEELTPTLLVAPPPPTTVLVDDG